ncbi:Meteorin-like protein [Halotydeus destructor]|nr:Meteorin-like protein [Halotydeus destructor]
MRRTARPWCMWPFFVLLVAWTTTTTVIIQPVDSKPRLLASASNLQLNNEAFSDSCDWEGSGLYQKSADRVVVPVYLRCSQGTVRWLYPTSALQITLRYGSHSGDFRGCIKVSRNVTSSVRVYVDGLRESLHKVYSVDDGQSPDLLRCFVSTKGQVSLYIEAEEHKHNIVKHELFQFSYHLQPVHSKKALNDEADECRPCSDYEIHTAYCVSDFVIRGTISSMFNNKALQMTELSIKASEIKRDLMPTSANSTALAGKHAVLYRPMKCHSKAGLHSEFLFIGHWVLGSPVIKCAPHMSYWKHVKSRAIALNANQCQLD